MIGGIKIVISDDRSKMGFSPERGTAVPFSNVVLFYACFTALRSTEKKIFLILGVDVDITDTDTQDLSA